MKKGIQLIFSIIFTVFIITSAVKISLGNKWLYNFDIDNLEITETVNMKKDIIIKNYNIIIDYLQGKKDKLLFSDFKMSDAGKSHFEDVKNIYSNVDKIFFVSLFITMPGLILFIKKKYKEYLLYTSIILLTIPVILLSFIFTDFNYLFTLFHKATFNNDLWLLDPNLDPVIEILPETYFMHQAVFILLELIISAIILLIIHKKLKNKTLT